MYKKKRDELIRTKGYDADLGIGKIISMVTVAALLVAAFRGDEDGGGNIVLLCIMVAVASVAVNVLLRIKAIGIKDAILISLEQTVYMVGGAFVWIAKTIWSMFNGFTGKHIDAEAKKGKAQQEAERKAALMREYEASVAAIERGSDEIADLTGETDAAIAQATADYEHKADMIDHEYKG